MLYALGFIGLFTIGGLTGLFLASLGMDVHLTDSYFVIAHFHYVMVGGAIMGFLGGIHYWWPKIFGRMYDEGWSKISAVIVFVGFNLTFFPQFLLGYMGMPRRYHAYPPEFQVLNVFSTAGATILGVGYLLPVLYLTWSLKYGAIAGNNPWQATGLEWQIQSPPLTENFTEIPIMDHEAYDYEWLENQNPDRQKAKEVASAGNTHGEHPPYLRHHFESEEQQADAAGFAMWLFLLTEVMFFGGLFTAYLIYRNWYYPAFVAGSHQLNVYWGTLNTLVLISSSFTMAMGVWCAETRRKSGLVLCLTLTLILGLGFLGIKTIEYSEKIEKHHVPGFHYSVQSFVDPDSDPAAKAAG
jgi:heme/copper-type cytochrome/quinol oxidase subunit 3